MNPNHSRRNFIRQSMIGAGLLYSGGFPSPNAHPAASLPAIGLIPSVIEDELKKDWKSALSRVAEIGYTHLEYGNYYGDSLSAFKKFIKDIKLTSLAGGSVMKEMIKEDALKRMIDDALALEKKYLVCYWPWLDEGSNKKLGDFQKAADNLNRIGERCSQGGIRFAFHNHDKEFAPVEGYDSGYEVILKYTEPRQVAMLLDLYWIIKGGADPISFLDRHPERFELFHVKDMDNTPQRQYTCPGSGIIDFPAIFTHAKKAGVKYYIVEVDKQDDGMQCIKESYSYVKALLSR